MSSTRTFPGLLEAFFVDRLMRQRKVSSHTVASYRDTFRLLLSYAQRTLDRAPSDLTLTDLDTPFIGASSITLNKSATIPRAAGTFALQLSTPSSDTSHCTLRSTALWRNVCSRCPVSATFAGRSLS